MISDELLSKFDRIHDLPVSEEMLGAYLEGNLMGSEFREVHNLIGNDHDLCDFCESISLDNQLSIDTLTPITIGDDIYINGNDNINIDINSIALPLISSNFNFGELGQNIITDEPALFLNEGDGSILDNDHTALDSTEFNDMDKYDV